MCPQAGALLAIGVVNTCVQNENDPAFALIADYVSNSDVNIRTGALQPAGARHHPITAMLIPRWTARMHA